MDIYDLIVVELAYYLHSQENSRQGSVSIDIVK